MTAAEMLVEARTASGLTQTQLAERTGIPQPAISAYERGRRVPGADMFLRLLAATGAVVQLQFRLDPDDHDSTNREHPCLDDNSPTSREGPHEAAP